MTKHIIVGYDGSASSSNAVRWAAAEASIRGTDLQILTCYELPVANSLFGGLPTATYMALFAQAETQLNAMRQIVVEEHPDLNVAIVAAPGPAGSVLVDDAGVDDLIAVGASSHEGPAAFWLGSTPRFVTRHAECPVIVVRGVAGHRRANRVVVGIDGSPAAQEALEWAGDEADRHGVPLVVVHGWEYPYIFPDVTTVEGARNLTRVDAACVLNRAVQFARERFATDVSGQLVESSAATALLDTANDGDLLVVGSGRRDRKGRLARFFGSTVNTVLEHAVVPVAVVRG